MKKSDLVLTLGMRLALLACIFILCYVLTAGLTYVLSRVLADKPAAAMRIAAMAQDVIAFIVPALATACIVCRRPAELLAIDKLHGKFTLPLIVILMVVSIPAMECVIQWNNSVSFPEEINALFRAMEDAAAASMRVLLENTSIPALLVNILIIGVAAGFAEEFLFRGCFLRLLTTGGVNKHAAVWIVAFVFSALHFQAFGFVPRMLLGAYFGYLLLWTRSIWAPVTAHVLNNSIFVIISWLELRRNPDALLTQEHISFSWPLIACSAIATAAALYILYRTTNQKGEAL